jgi:transposase
VGAARYPEEFKRDAVELVLSTGRSIGSVAKDLGVNTESLRPIQVGNLTHSLRTHHP